jgi:hypothetical protein
VLGAPAGVQQATQQPDVARAQAAQLGVVETEDLPRQRSDRATTRRRDEDVRDLVIAHAVAGLLNDPVEGRQCLQIVVERIGKDRLGEMAGAIERVGSPPSWKTTLLPVALAVATTAAARRSPFSTFARIW